MSKKIIKPIYVCQPCTFRNARVAETDAEAEAAPARFDSQSEVEAHIADHPDHWIVVGYGADS